MGALWLAIFILAVCIGGFFFSAESRPGFAEERTDTKDRWYYHDRRS